MKKLLTLTVVSFTAYLSFFSVDAQGIYCPAWTDKQMKESNQRFQQGKVGNAYAGLRYVYRCSDPWPGNGTEVALDELNKMSNASDRMKKCNYYGNNWMIHGINACLSLGILPDCIVLLDDKQSYMLACCDTCGHSTLHSLNMLGIRAFTPMERWGTIGGADKASTNRGASQTAHRGAAKASHRGAGKASHSGGTGVEPTGDEIWGQDCEAKWAKITAMHSAPESQKIKYIKDCKARFKERKTNKK